MKFIHISDLHIGKKVNEFNITEDQKHILKKIINIIKEEKCSGVFISGDVYDKTIPSGEAVMIFDDFLTELSLLGVKVFIISGNHDSAERLEFCSRIVRDRDIYIASVFKGYPEKVTLKENDETVNIFMLPFVKPATVRPFFQNETIETYNEAVKLALSSAEINKSETNILLAHQFVTGAVQSDSEEISVGGIDNVNADVFEQFDYVALGHIHRPQNILSGKLRYCGTPLKYSFSEADHKKSVTVVETEKSGKITISTRELKPLHDMKIIEGSYMEVIGRDFYKELDLDDYYKIILTDEKDIPDVIGKLRTVYKNIMRLEYKGTAVNSDYFSNDVSDKVENKSPLELFEQLYKLQNNRDMDTVEKSFLKNIMEEVWEENP